MGGEVVRPDDRVVMILSGSPVCLGPELAKR